jgi:hypothetical protein
MEKSATDFLIAKAKELMGVYGVGLFKKAWESEDWWKAQIAVKKVKKVKKVKELEKIAQEAPLASVRMEAIKNYR